MNNKEKETIEKLVDAVEMLISANKEQARQIEIQNKELNLKIEKKNLPITLEEGILQNINQNIAASLSKILAEDYNSPLKPIIKAVVEKNNVQITSLVEAALKGVVEDNVTLKDELERDFSKKIARSIISTGDGVIEKIMNSLKQNQLFRSELTVLVSRLVRKFKVEE